MNMKLSKLIKGFALLLILGCASSASAQVRSTTQDITTSASECTPVNTTAMAVLNTSGMGTIGISVSGTWTGTITFKISNDGVTWDLARVNASNDSTLLTTVSSNGHWSGNVSGFNFFCAAFLSAPTGTAHIVLNAIASGGSTTSSSGDLSSLSSDLSLSRIANETAAAILADIKLSLSKDANLDQTSQTTGPQGYCNGSTTTPTVVTTNGNSIRIWCNTAGAIFYSLVDAGTNAKIGGDATNGLDVDVTRMKPDGTNTMPSGDTAARSFFTHPSDGTNSTLDPCTYLAWTTVPINQTASTKLISQTSAKKNYICALLIIPQAAEIVNVVEGTGSTCGTSKAAVVGSATASEGLSFLANGGWVNPIKIPGIGTNVDTCITQNGSSRLSGYLSYVQN